MEPSHLSILLRLASDADNGRDPHDGTYSSHGPIQFVRAGPYLVFAGSNEPLDWVYNLDFRLTPNPIGAGHLHRGFYRASEAAWRSIKRDGLNSHPEPVHFVAGHSFGGAIAAIMSQWLENVEVTLFSSPQIGDSDFWTHYPHPIHHFHLTPDLITLLPPWPRFRSCPKSTAIPGHPLNFLSNHRLDRLISRMLV